MVEVASRVVMMASPESMMTTTVMQEPTRSTVLPRHQIETMTGMIVMATAVIVAIAIWRKPFWRHASRGRVPDSLVYHLRYRPWLDFDCHWIATMTTVDSWTVEVLPQLESD